MLALSRTIFKAYDIRGIVGSTLDAGVARQIGQAFARSVLTKGETTVIIGRDGRLSSPELAAQRITIDETIDEMGGGPNTDGTNAEEESPAMPDDVCQLVGVVVVSF